jgi:biopolymer transport protein TolR
MPESEREIKVSIKADGAVFIGDNWVPDKDIAGALSMMHSQSPNKNVVVKADKNLKYKQVRSVMRLINEAGFTGVGLVTEKRDRG